MVAGWPEEDNPWGDQDSENDWANWTSAPQEVSGPLPLYKTLSETFRAHNYLSAYPANHLFMGLNPGTGAPEMMGMDKPRSLMIRSSHSYGPQILKTMATAIKWRANQQHMPITVLSDDHSDWLKLGQQYPDVTVLSPDSCGKEMRNLIDNTPQSPHFLIIEDLGDLLKLDPHDSSVMSILISQGAIHHGVYVLCSREPIDNFKSNNKMGHFLDHGNLLNGKTSGPNTLILANGANIWVPNPQ